MEQIKSLQHLKELASTDEAIEEGLEVFISLNGGLRSSKRIYYDKPLWDIINEIDDSEQEGLTDIQLETDTNIVEAITAGALYLY